MPERKSQLWVLAIFASAVIGAAGGITPLFAGDPGWPIFVGFTGGGYRGTVGKPIEFDASPSVNTDSDAIVGHYWDWLGDDVLEYSTLPQCQHTWHCAYSGKVGVYIFDEGDHLGYGETDVVVEGPKTALCATLKSHADLHVYGPRNRHVGLDYGTGTLEKQLADCSVTVLDPDGQETPFTTAISEGCSQTIGVPLYLGGTYQVRVVGASDGPFELALTGIKDGEPCAEKTFSGEICKGEAVTLEVECSCTGGQLKVQSGDLVYRPGLAVEPGAITLVVEAGKTYEVELAVRELFGKVKLAGVSLRNEEIKGSVNGVGAGKVSFSANNFDVDPGGEQTVVASIPVPASFLGKAAGPIVVTSGNGGSRTIDVTIKTAGSCPPHCNGIGPYTGTVGVPIVFDASNSYDPDGEIIQYGWDWDDDGNFEYTVESTIAHTWDAPFEGTVRLLVIDNEGNVDEQYVEVTVEPAP